MKRLLSVIVFSVAASSVCAAPISVDLAGVHAGPVAAAVKDQALVVDWRDAAHHQWQTRFSLDSAQPLIASISADGKNIVESVWPYYRCTTGKRSGGWDAFFDFPPDNPAGTRQFLAEFHPTAASVRTVGDRLEVTFDGMKIGIFGGSLRYTFYPGTPLIQQTALVSTQEPDTAYFYDAGIEMTASQDITAGKKWHRTFPTTIPMASSRRSRRLMDRTVTL